MLKKERKYDNVNHPKHYSETSLECIDIMIITFGADVVAMNCCINCFKYLFRYESKNGVEDLKKAEWYLNKCLNINKDYGVRLPVQYKELRVTLNHHLEEWRKKNGNEKAIEIVKRCVGDRGVD